MSDNRIELIPDAHLLMSSLRSVGYKTETAIADIVDNCIAAHANYIRIDFNWDDSNSEISIFDNGKGMDKSALIASMKIGSSNPADRRDNDDLGRFGMGMKTAAFSIGKVLRVITKNQGVVSTACWDLNLIEKMNDGKWNLIVDDISENDILGKFPFLANYDSGTIVLINALDSLVDLSSIKKSKNSFYRTVERTKSHIGMIFHRFIEEDGLVIAFKDEPIIAWNPFIPANSATQELSEEEYYNDGKYVLIQPYILPHKTKFSTNEEFEYASGPKGWMSQQGIYVYRNRRLLVYGTWFDFIKKEPAFNLARIKLDMSAEQDYDWKIDIKKSIATPPIYIRDMLDRAITLCTTQSAKVYNSRGTYSKNSGSQQLSFVWEQRKNRLGAYMFYLNKKHPMLNKVFSKLDEEGKADLKAYLALIEGYSPSAQSGLTAYLADSSKSLDSKDSSAIMAEIAEAKTYIKKFLDNGFDKDEVEGIILGMPNYKHIEAEIMKIFEDENYD